MASGEHMRHLDAVLDSSLFWGVLSLISLFLSPKLNSSVVRAVLFGFSWLAGSYALYRLWSINTAQVVAFLLGFLLCYAGILLLIYSWLDPTRPISRPISGEPFGRGDLVASLSFLNVGALPTQEAPIADPPDWIAPTTR
jgi:hypothetical protein